jgi:transposase
MPSATGYGEVAIRALFAEITKIEAKLMAWHKHNELSRRLEEVPGVGPIGAPLAAMKVPDPHAFSCGRDFSAWLGSTPKDHSTAGKTRLKPGNDTGKVNLKECSRYKRRQKSNVRRI